MKFLFFEAVLLASSAFALRETVQQAVLHARRLMHEESILTVSSVFSEEVNSVLAGQPFAWGPFFLCVNLFDFLIHFV